MSAMSEALLISPAVPHFGGLGMRTHAWIRTLQKHYTVRLWTADLYRNVTPANIGLLADQLGVASIDLLPAMPRAPRRLRVRAMLRPSLSVQQSLLRPGGFAVERRTVKAIAARYQAASFQKVVVYRMGMDGVAEHLRALGLCPSAEWALDMDDLESDAKQSMGRRMLMQGRVRTGVAMLLAARQFAALESVIPAKYHTVYLSAREDAEALGRRRNGVKAQVLANRIPRAERLPDVPSGCWNLLFVGSLGYYQNEDAVCFLLDSILPALRRRESMAWRLIIAGSNPPAWMQARCARLKDVELVNTPADIQPVYARAHAVLSPLRCGGGTRLKMLEAFAWGRPVIGTLNSARGIGALPDVHYAHAETGDAFAAQIIRLMSDTAFCARIVAHGLTLAAQHFLD
jgi:glycosyltransferase involved in cell wall biosynthesis